ncbi:MAG: HupE/UreJ family protein [Gammaproteobacteria bacterium]|nr:HupE/UreJ family protein [Gammaproteobacteria bacterium]
MILSRRTFGFLFFLASLLVTSIAFGHGMSEEEKQSIIEGGNLSYLWLGATHMLTGYDHLAFVFGIIFFLTTFKEIVKYITAFTLGHSVTLIFATFNGIQMNYFVIDAIIGLSVAYIAFANMDGFRKHLKIPPPNLLIMIVVLGLIHGLGLSTRLQQLPLSEDALLMNIISFNVGIEFGQITALTVMLLVLTGWRKAKSFENFSRVSNYALIFCGVYLFLMQMHGYAHVSAPDEFGFAADNHAHEHMQMPMPEIDLNSPQSSHHDSLIN